MKKTIIRKFIQKNYSDENLAHLLFECEIGLFDWRNCYRCLLGLSDAGYQYHTTKRFGHEAEMAALTLGWSFSRFFHGESARQCRSRIIGSIARKEITRRHNLVCQEVGVSRGPVSPQFAFAYQLS